MKNVFATEW